MKYITPSILLALAALGLCLWFLYRCARSAQAVDMDWLRGQSPRPTLAGNCHPMEQKDRLPVLLITLVYAFTAFFQLGDFSAPLEFVDFKDQGTVTVSLHSPAGERGTAVYSTGLRYYPGLGTGSYNLEISSDGGHWSTLWPHKDEDGKITGYYWADAEGYDPSYALSQGYNQLFKWVDITVDNPQNIAYLRITGKGEKSVLELGKLALLGKNGEVLPLCCEPVTPGEALPQQLPALFDGQGVPEKSTWHNSTYFDEIYHARTAKEHIDNVYPYEVTHPPLGKLILGIGIRLFGMTPFGWRFMGTLFGVGMLPLLYVFLKNMFGKTTVAACGTTLFAAEFMHLTQTRIATIDTYGVFFILAMYFFMYRYLTLPAGTSFRKGALPLFLSGLMWGLGLSSKWTVIYGGLGLAVVYFMGLYQKLRDWPQEKGYDRGAWVAQTLLFSVFCFILMPFAIYCASYLPYAKALGVAPFAHSEVNGLGLLLQNVLDKLTGAAGEAGYQAASIPQDNLLNIMAGNQWYMFSYHNGVTSSHPYSSWWFQWIVNARPILYYMDNTVAGYTTRFAAFANPIVCWAGLGAILICFANAFRQLWAKLAFLGGLGVASALLIRRIQTTPNGVFDPELTPQVLGRNTLILIACLCLYLLLSTVIAFTFQGRSWRNSAFISVAFLSQLIPWMFIGRTTFEYHYFPSILFLVFALSALFDYLMGTDKNWKKPVYALTGAAVGCYALFYPVLIGLQIPTWYEPVVKWIESWPF